MSSEIYERAGATPSPRARANGKPGPVTASLQPLTAKLSAMQGGRKAANVPPALTLPHLFTPDAVPDMFPAIAIAEGSSASRL